MNKLMGIPMLMLFLIALYAMASSSSMVDFTGGLDNGITTGDEHTHHTFGIGWSWPWEDPSTSTGIQQTTFFIWGIGGALMILAAAITAGTISGINVLGSGLSDFSQRLIFSAALYFGTWTCLTAASNSVIALGSGESIGLMIWISLTIMFVLGFGQSVLSSSGDA